MSCELTNIGHTIECFENNSGVKEIYVGQWSGSTTFALGTSDIVTGFTGSNSFFTVEQDIEQAFVDQTKGGARGTGSVMYDQTVTFIVPKLTATRRAAYHNLFKTRSMAMVLDNNSNYWLFGADSGLWALEGDTTAGISVEQDGLNGFSIALNGKNSVPAYNVTAAAAAAVIV